MNETIDTENKSLNKWIAYFNKNKIDNNLFILLCKKLDKSFLCYEHNYDIEHPLFNVIPLLGFLEKDFLTVLNSLDEDKNGAFNEKTRLVLALSQNVNFSSLRKKYKSYYNLVFERCFLDGYYELYGLEFDKIIKKAIKQKILIIEDALSIALLRGVVLKNRYPNKIELKKLDKLKFKNKFKRLYYQIIY